MHVVAAVVCFFVICRAWQLLSAICISLPFYIQLTSLVLLSELALQAFCTA